MRRLIALAVLLFAVVVLGVGQLVLPGLAARSIRDRLARSGRVLDVQVGAFPAVELLWHHADTVTVRLGRYRSTPPELGRTVSQAIDVGTLTASAAELDTGLVTLRDTILRKRGAQLTASALVTEADLRSALPILDSVTPVASAGGRLTLEGTASLFGVSATVDAEVRAEDGALVVAPDVPFGGFVTVTAFADPHIEVQSVGARPAAGGFSVTATARLR